MRFLYKFLILLFRRHIENLMSTVVLKLSIQYYLLHGVTISVVLQCTKFLGLEELEFTSLHKGHRFQLKIIRSQALEIQIFHCSSSR